MRLVFVREPDLELLGGAMTTTVLTELFNHRQPVTESEFLAFDETSDRIELIDGSLLVSPGPTTRHQRILQQLFITTHDAAKAVGLDVDLGLNVRLHTDRIFIPDLVISSGVDSPELIIDAAKVRLVCEVLSPFNSSTDKVVKMLFYALAGIQWYLLIEQETCTLRLYQLVGAAYKEHSVTRPGEILHLTDPIAISIDPADLQPPH
jgi:Uma2 family endonuclease